MFLSRLYQSQEFSEDKAFSHDVTAAILVFQNNEAATMLVYQDNPVGKNFLSFQ